MKLSYRGIRYNSHATAVTLAAAPVAVRYRGLTYRGSRHHFNSAEAVANQAPVLAKYRGLTYKIPQMAITN